MLSRHNENIIHGINAGNVADTELSYNILDINGEKAKDIIKISASFLLLFFVSVLLDLVDFTIIIDENPMRKKFVRILKINYYKVLKW